MDAPMHVRLKKFWTGKDSFIYMQAYNLNVNVRIRTVKQG